MSLLELHTQPYSWSYRLWIVAKFSVLMKIQTIRRSWFPPKLKRPWREIAYDSSNRKGFVVGVVIPGPRKVVFNAEDYGVLKLESKK